MHQMKAGMHTLAKKKLPPLPPKQIKENNTTPTSDEMNEIKETMSKFMNEWL